MATSVRFDWALLGMIQDVIIQPILRVSLVILAGLEEFVTYITTDGNSADIITRCLPFDEVWITIIQTCKVSQVFLAWL